MFTIQLDGEVYKFSFEYGRKKGGPNKGNLTGRTHAVVSKKIAEVHGETNVWEEIARTSVRCDRRDAFSKNEGRKESLKKLLENTFDLTISTNADRVETREFRTQIWNKYFETVSEKYKV